MTGGQKESVWTFAKLVGPSNYTEWAKNMEFALLDSDLWGITSGVWKKPEEADFDEKDDFRTEKNSWESANAKARGKIGLMCQKTVQMTLKSESTADEMWRQLREDCTPKGWNNKWEVMSKLEQLHLTKVKSMDEFHVQIMKAKADIDELQISIDDYLVIKVLNSLDARYDTWVTLLSQKAREDEEKKLPSLDTIFQNLKQEEYRHTTIEKANVARGGGNQGNQRGRGGRGGGRGGGRRGGRGRPYS